MAAMRVKSLLHCLSSWCFFWQLQRLATDPGHCWALQHQVGSQGFFGDRDGKSNYISRLSRHWQVWFRKNDCNSQMFKIKSFNSSFHRIFNPNEFEMCLPMVTCHTSEMCLKGWPMVMHQWPIVSSHWRKIQNWPLGEFWRFEIFEVSVLPSLKLT